jgi:hypothetical protein
MATAAVLEENVGRSSATSLPLPSQGEDSVSIATAPLWATLHYSSDAGGSAAQFNRSVSAMPPHAPTKSPRLSTGTADTLLLG